MAESDKQESKTVVGSSLIRTLRQVRIEGDGSIVLAETQAVVLQDMDGNLYAATADPLPVLHEILETLQSIERMQSALSGVPIQR